uniref:Uncharacterized protein n=1 Tax=Phlebotomus papatasi TaxID=29031 RepID=A0A1B0DI18_PHLPP
MWRFLVVGALVSVVFAVKLEKCPGLNHLASDQMRAMKLIVLSHFPKNTIHVFPSIMFLYYEDGVQRGELPINIDIRRGCKFIVSHTCPLKKGDIITWAMDWDFLPAEVARVDVEPFLLTYGQPHATTPFVKSQNPFQLVLNWISKLQMTQFSSSQAFCSYINYQKAIEERLVLRLT